MGAGTSNAPPPVKEGGVPAVAKYTPRFKPQASAGSRGTAPRKMVDENKTPLAATTFQSMLHCSFHVTLTVHHVHMCTCVEVFLCLSLCYVQAHKQQHSSLRITQHLKVGGYGSNSGSVVCVCTYACPTSCPALVCLLHSLLG